MLIIDMTASQLTVMFCCRISISFLVRSLNCMFMRFMNMSCLNASFHRFSRGRGEGVLAAVIVTTGVESSGSRISTDRVSTALLPLLSWIDPATFRGEAFGMEPSASELCVTSAIDFRKCQAMKRRLTMGSVRFDRT